MQPHPDYLTTSAHPGLQSFLGSELPSIFTCSCDNPDQNSFAQEVTNTELAHLFEHVLLEYLCDEKISTNTYPVAYSGRTFWGDRDLPKGTFRIKISMSDTEANLLNNALSKAHTLMSKLYTTTNSSKELSAVPHV